MVLMSSWGLYNESIFQEISVVASSSPAMDKKQEQEQEQEPPPRNDMQEFFLMHVLRDADLENVMLSLTQSFNLTLISLYERIK